MNARANLADLIEICHSCSNAFLDSGLSGIAAVHAKGHAPQSARCAKCTCAFVPSWRDNKPIAYYARRS